MESTKIDRIEEHRVYTPAEIGSFYRYSASFIREQCRKGKMPHRKCGRDFRITGAGALKWYDELPMSKTDTASSSGEANGSCDGKKATATEKLNLAF